LCLEDFDEELAAFLALPQEEIISKLAARIGMIFLSVIEKYGWSVHKVKKNYGKICTFVVVKILRNDKS